MNPNWGRAYGKGREGGLGEVLYPLHAHYTQHMMVQDMYKSTYSEARPLITTTTTATATATATLLMLMMMLLMMFWFITSQCPNLGQSLRGRRVRRRLFGGVSP